MHVMQGHVQGKNNAKALIINVCVYYAVYAGLLYVRTYAQEHKAFNNINIYARIANTLHNLHNVHNVVTTRPSYV